ncbi:MAG: GreA/GreB family elongation factor [Myxococcota bacterium]
MSPSTPARPGAGIPTRQAVIAALVDRLRTELDAQLAVAKMASDEATGEQSKAENQYDTRSLEASYLARGQAERVGALRGLLGFLEGEIPPVGATVGLCAVVGLDGDDGPIVALLVPREGGRRLVVDGVEVVAVTPEAPLGRGLLGKEVGDTIEVETATGPAGYEITALR